VDWLHWQGEVTAARTALRAEMVPIADYYRMRVAIAPCVNRKLEAVSVLIADAAAGRKVETGDLLFNGLGAAIYDSEWQSQRASQTLTHFPRQELALMSAFYGQRQTMEDWSLEEAAAWAHLAVLQDAAQKLGPGDLAQLRVASHLARRYQNAITGNAALQLDVAARLGSGPQPRRHPGSRTGATDLRAKSGPDAGESRAVRMYDLILPPSHRPLFCAYLRFRHGGG
jgi:hypothetical protein